MADETARLEQSITRLADAVGMLRPSAAHRRDGHISTIRCSEDLAEMSIGELAYLHNHPEHPMREKVDATCSLGCGAAFQCERWVSQVTACDECVTKSKDADALARVKKHWEKICPKGFRDTDKQHAGFPRAQLAELKDWDCTKSLLMYGPTGQGKTRLALLMLKRAMMRNHWVDVLWPEKLRSLVQGYDSTVFDRYAGYDVLMMDDPLITACRESKLVDALKNLVDVRMREKKVTIFTSQIGDEEELAGAKEFGEAKTADLERIKALMRRLREDCQVVSFAQAVAAGGERGF